MADEFGADYVWALSFALPYIAIFLAFVIYPICYGLWLGQRALPV